MTWNGIQVANPGGTLTFASTSFPNAATNDQIVLKKLGPVLIKVKKDDDD
jgi:hypothetical protein